VGPVRGADTTRPPLAGEPGARAHDLATRAALTVAVATDGTDGHALARRHACISCHAVDQRLVGPSFREVAAKYRGAGDAASALVAKMKTGGVGVWGPVPMPPQAHVAEADLHALARWILGEPKEQGKERP
jgi:cytochrome c